MTFTEDEARKIARAIAFGHANRDHATHLAEAGDLISESSFESLILETILNPAKTRSLKSGRFAYWHAEEKFLVIFNPLDPDLGTAYWPTKGIHEYRKLY